MSFCEISDRAQILELFSKHDVTSKTWWKWRGMGMLVNFISKKLLLNKCSKDKFLKSLIAIKGSGSLQQHMPITASSYYMPNSLSGPN